MTTAVSAVINIILNFLLIPMYGIQGAGISTLISYLAMFLIRAVHSRSFIKIDLGMPKLIINTAILLTQVIILLVEGQNWFIYELILVVIALGINIKTLLTGLRKVVVS
jgi:O-antigen/teichoic acid export membrane protein